MAQQKPFAEGFNRKAFEQLCSRKFFYNASFEIYGSVAGLYDYGPPGAALKSNLLTQWRKWFVAEENMLEVDCTSLTIEPVLKSSGHVDRFADLMVQDTVTHEYLRADHVLKEWAQKEIAALTKDGHATHADKLKDLEHLLGTVDDLKQADISRVFVERKVTSPAGNPLGEVIPFNLMFQTAIGPAGLIKAYMRPETAQGIFVNFRRLLEYNGGRVPFAAAQIGNAYRNEIAPRAGLLRVREFTMAEIEHFVDPKNKTHRKFCLIKDIPTVLFDKHSQASDAPAKKMTFGEAVAQGTIGNETLAYFMARTQLFLFRIGVKPQYLRFRQHMANEMAHYATDCWDAEIECSYGFVECVGHADRACFDLTVHMKKTGVDLDVYEPYDTPKVVEALAAKPNRGAIGKEFRKDAKEIMALLEGMSEADLVNLQTQLATGKATITVNGQELTVTPAHVTVEKVQKKINGERFVPNVIEPSFGIGRILYCMLEHAYYTREGDEQRAVLGLSPVVAPTQVVVLPLSGQEQFVAPVQQIASALSYEGIFVKIDESSASVGRRYARADEVGTPFAITVDFETTDATSARKDTVTLRSRDSCKQVRVPMADIPQLLMDLVNMKKSWDDAEKVYPSVAAVSE